MRNWIRYALLTALPLGAAAATAGIVLVQSGQPAAVIVTPDRPTDTVRYAAKELVYHLRRATGATLAVTTESAAPAGGDRIYLGATQAALAAGIDAPHLARETFTMRTVSHGLIIAGRDDAGDPLEMETSAGTLFGVYELLQHDLGVRWLWPGELGTFVPKAATITIAPQRETITPPFSQRYVRPGLSFDSEEYPALGFTRGAAEAYARAQTVFLRRNRMGKREKLAYGHAFTDWWPKYGKEHPDWFQLVNGKRGPVKSGGRYSMSVSSQGLQEEIVRRWEAHGGSRQHPSVINAVENDIPGMCQCDDCKALDGPTPADYQPYTTKSSKTYGMPFVSDRYAHFWLDIQQRAAKENPDVTVVGYAYFNYFHAPTSGIKLNSHILIGYCPSAGWYPRAPDEQDWYERQWKGWHDTGARMFCRTNYFLDGYGMPFIFAHQFAADFKWEARDGMIGTDFDSLTGQWGTQGPNLYLLLQLENRPDAPTDDLLGEYYAAFGPAASLVKQYFDYWEAFTMGHRAEITRTFERMSASRWRTWAKAANAVYPASCFGPAEATLAKAAAAAAGDPEAAARVDFLRKGLRHAELCSRVAGLLTLGDPASTPERGAQALRELLVFRRANERTWIGNFNFEAWEESLSWKLSKETRQAPDLYP